MRGVEWEIVEGTVFLRLFVWQVVGPTFWVIEIGGAGPRSKLGLTWGALALGALHGEALL